MNRQKFSYPRCIIDYKSRINKDTSPPTPIGIVKNRRDECNDKSRLSNQILTH